MAEAQPDDLPHNAAEAQVEALQQRLAGHEVDDRLRVQAAFERLAVHAMHVANTRRGYPDPLQAAQVEVLRFAAGFQSPRIWSLFTAQEHQRTLGALERILTALGEAAREAADPALRPPPQIVRLEFSGRSGRPRIEIDPLALGYSLTMVGAIGVARALGGISARTVRRRAVEYGLVEPGDPVFLNIDTEEGPAVVHTTATRPVSNLTNAEVAAEVESTLKIFPNHGIRMLTGSIRAAGHDVPRERLQAAYLDVHGPPAVFGDRPIVRREYVVRGPWSIIHVDTQHALINFGIITIGFIDGYSRVVPFIDVQDNNRADSAFVAFRKLCASYGVPSRVRGDHGMENLRIAGFMEKARGLNRGSFLWGRSVHNIRIERLWRDIKRGFAWGWKERFEAMEKYDDLDVHNRNHIWLLHFLFLKNIREHAQTWARGWNEHPITLPDNRRQTPRQLLWFGMLQHGIRAMPLAEADARVAEGIPWQPRDDDPDEDAELFRAEDPGNPFLPNRTPTRLNRVDVHSPECEMPAAAVEVLRFHLGEIIDSNPRDTYTCRLLWRYALAMAQRLWER